QAEDGIRDFHVTGVQTCALPISFRTLAECSLDSARKCVYGKCSRLSYADSMASRIGRSCGIESASHTTTISLVASRTPLFRDPALLNVGLPSSATTISAPGSIDSMWSYTYLNARLRSSVVPLYGKTTVTFTCRPPPRPPSRRLGRYHSRTCTNGPHRAAGLSGTNPDQLPVRHRWRTEPRFAPESRPASRSA